MPGPVLSTWMQWWVTERPPRLSWPCRSALEASGVDRANKEHVSQPYMPSSSILLLWRHYCLNYCCSYCNRMTCGTPWKIKEFVLKKQCVVSENMLSEKSRSPNRSVRVSTRAAMTVTRCSTIWVILVFFFPNPYFLKSYIATITTFYKTNTSLKLISKVLVKLHFFFRHSFYQQNNFKILFIHTLMPSFKKI